MNKTELIEHIAKQAGISKAAASRALEVIIGSVKSTLKKNDTVTIVGFGTFSVSKRAARTGRNPRSGESIKIQAAKVPKFRPGKDLIASVAGKHLLDPVVPEPEPDKRPPKKKIVITKRS
ncbi:HU family DNA-binding protein [Roseateles sp.]|uniref:HU family DNA-binding protein n=1 Tax=Roseateles sp. TaxID=1971397 RepID=UPI0039EAE4CE